MDTFLFLEIIESEGAILLGEDYKRDFVIRRYQGKNGRLVVIDCTNGESIPVDTCVIHLFNLGMADLIPGMFPGYDFEA